MTAGAAVLDPGGDWKGVFHRLGADGLRATTGRYERVLDALVGWIGAQRPADAEVFRFPPLMSRSQIERSGYLKSFPNLIGCCSCLQGDERTLMAAADDAGWTALLAASDLVLTPASCYPVYPIAAARGPVPQGGWRFEVACDCFRREPSRDIDRLQSFRMREFVCIGSEAQVRAFRQDWLDRAVGFAGALGLPGALDVASDPFFGRGASFLAASQKAQSLKFELLVPVISEEKPTACLSFNYHQDHFGHAWGLRLASGEVAETACVAFGMDRLATALFVHHGADPADWPASVREALRL